MRGRTIISSDGVIQFNRILDELKSSINDLMNIADNMIPEEVINNGIKDYITKTCKALTDNDLKINIEISQEFEGLHENITINVYKVFRSLVHYLVNYTEATEISFIFSIYANTIKIQVIDDGKNFNLSALSYPGIDYLAEIKSIIEKMGGNFSILRNNDKNETNITIPL